MSSAPLRIERADTPVAAAHPHTQLRLLESPERRRRPSARAVRIYALGALVGFLLAALLSAPGGTEIVAIQLVGAALAGAAAALARSAELRTPPSRLSLVTEAPRRTLSRQLGCGARMWALGRRADYSAERAQEADRPALAHRLRAGTPMDRAGVTFLSSGLFVEGAFDPQVACLQPPLR